jgi:cbb3-type cytochrome oxidase subunit 3
MEHHVFTNAIPDLTDPQFAELKADIAKNGQHHAITIFEGKILDGRGRYRACVELGVEPKCENFAGDDPEAFAIGQNLKRKNITGDQRTILTDARRKKVKDLSESGLVVQKIATELGVSNATVQGDLAKMGVHPGAVQAEEPAEPAKKKKKKRAPSTIKMPKPPRVRKPFSKRKRLIIALSVTAFFGLCFIGYSVYNVIDRHRMQEAERQMWALEDDIMKLQIQKHSSGGSDKKSSQKWSDSDEQSLQKALKEHAEFIKRFPRLEGRAFMRRN